MNVHLPSTCTRCVVSDTNFNIAVDEAMCTLGIRASCLTLLDNVVRMSSIFTSNSKLGEVRKVGRDL